MYYVVSLSTHRYSIKYRTDINRKKKHVSSCMHQGYYIFQIRHGKYKNYPKASQGDMSCLFLGA